MTSGPTHQSDILSQIIQLYELSLAVGSSTSLLQNCEHFFDRILARRNLSYASLWIQSPIDQPATDFLLEYSNPQNEYSGPTFIYSDTPLFKKIAKKQIFSMSREQLDTLNWSNPEYLPNGDSFTFIYLQGIGFIILAGYGSRCIWEPWQLSQMLPIFNSFATSIRANIHFEQLQVEIAERKNAEDKAIRASEIKSQFLANMSHELRTPLNAVLGISQLLEDTRLDSEQMELVETILHSGKSLLDLINDILDFSKLEANKISLECVNFNLIETCQIVHQTFRQQCRSKNLDLELAIDEKISPFCMGDSLRIKQVIMNLVSNAIKFTSQGKITISLEQESVNDDVAQIKFSVTDTGIGIDKENQDLLFESFQQVDSSTTRKFGGTGLGLSISKQLVELMQGSLSVESSRNRGSTFSFSIPLKVSRDQQSPGPVNKKTVISADTKKARILLVEDDKVNQMVACKLLEKLGYIADVAETGAEAIEFLEQHSYDLVFMDMQMPVMGGIEATRLIRKDDSTVKNPDITILAMTANAMESDRHLCLQAGMNDFMSKPISKESLIKKLDTWL